MWTGDEETYRNAFVEMIDYYLNLADKTASNPPEHRSRWHCDGAIWYWTYENNKTPAEFARLIERTRDGSISLPLNFLVSTHGGTLTEATLRGMYYAGSLERRFGLKIPVAIAMENQTLPYGLGGLWAGAGARYSWKGICGCLTKIKRTERRPHEIYWWPGTDGPVETLIKFTFGIKSAYRTTHIETDLEPVSLSVDGALSAKFARQQLQTYRIRTTVKGSNEK